MRNQDGFTLIELSTVVAILGVITAMGVTNYIDFKEDAERSSCITNQRNILHAAKLYSAENAVTGNLSVANLATAGYVSPEIGECPTASDHDNDDYTLTFAGDEVTFLGCLTEPAFHAWDLP